MKLIALKNSYFTPRLPSTFYSFYYSKLAATPNLFWKVAFYCMKRLGLVQSEVLSWTAIDSNDSHRTTSQYLTLQLQDSILLNAFSSCVGNKLKPVLDFGCNTGLYTSQLLDRGFNQVYGCDISARALKKFAVNFPNHQDKPVLVAQPAEVWLPKLRDGFFAGVVSRGAVIELIPAGFDVVSQLCRISSGPIALRINEIGHSTPRFYVHEFKRHGFLLKFLHRFDGLRDSVLIFSRLKEASR